MDHHCDLYADDLERLFQFKSRPNSTLNSNRQKRDLQSTMPLAPYQKLAILFEIIKEANTDKSKIQDAKDVLDFIQFEINQQAS